MPRQTCSAPTVRLADVFFASPPSLNMDGLPAERKVQGKCGSGAGVAFHTNLAGVLLNNSVGNRKPEASTSCLAFARRVLRGKERIVNALDMLGRNARSRIRNAHAYAVAVRSGHAQPSAAWH